MTTTTNGLVMPWACILLAVIISPWFIQNVRRNILCSCDEFSLKLKWLNVDCLNASSGDGNLVVMCSLFLLGMQTEFLNSCSVYTYRIVRVYPGRIYPSGQPRFQVSCVLHSIYSVFLMWNLLRLN